MCLTSRSPTLPALRPPRALTLRGVGTNVEASRERPVRDPFAVTSGDYSETRTVRGSTTILFDRRRSMQRRGSFLGRALAVVALAVLAAAPIHAAGFSIFEQGTKAMGMAGAFTAQADDPSLLFHNAGGLAFVTERQISVGDTWIHGLKAEFDGAAPFPGPSYSAEQKKLSAFPPHVYYVQPINSTWKFGLGIETPFGLQTEWENPDQFAGRFLSTK